MIQLSFKIYVMSKKSIGLREAAKITEISHLQNRPYDVDAEHPFYGRSYNAYRYLNTTFTVPSDSRFAKWFNDGILHTVEFQVGTRKAVDRDTKEEIDVESLQVVSCLSTKQHKEILESEMQDEKAAFQKRAYREMAATKVMDTQLLNELAND